jgi:hypothetical protein
MKDRIKRPDYLSLVEVFAAHPDFRTEEGRWKLIDEAFRGVPRADAAIGVLDLRDPLRSAATSLVGRLLDFGRLGERHTLSLVLETLRDRVGDERRAELDRLIGVLEGHQEATPAPLPGEPTAPEASTILFLAASPDGTQKLALDREAREIRGKIRAAEHRDSLVFHTEWAVRPDDLLQYLNERRPQAVHFSGHGTTGELILNDENGRAKPVTRAALRALFGLHAKTVRLVVLNACFSKEQADAIVEVIDRKLGFGDSVQAAFDEGCVALMLQGIPEEKTPCCACALGWTRAGCSWSGRTQTLPRPVAGRAGRGGSHHTGEPAGHPARLGHAARCDLRHRRHPGPEGRDPS